MTVSGSPSSSRAGDRRECAFGGCHAQMCRPPTDTGELLARGIRSTHRNWAIGAIASRWWQTAQPPQKEATSANDAAVLSTAREHSRCDL